jgi:hypothetical protein
MQPRYGLLLVAMNYSAAAEDEFNDWYDTEHVPERKRTPGFLNGRRWLGATDPKVSMTTYDLESLSVLETPAYQAIVGDGLSQWSRRIVAKCPRICRYLAEQTVPGRQAGDLGAEGLAMVALNVAPEADAEFNAWYNEEHIPRIAKVPGVLRARRFVMPTGTHRYLALYDLSQPDIQTSPAWKEAVETPWTAKMRPHFRDPLRLVMRLYHPKT